MITPIVVTTDGQIAVDGKTYKTAERCARAFAARNGYVSRKGGWIYDARNANRVVCQGYGAFIEQLRGWHIKAITPGDWRSRWFIANDLARGVTPA